MTNIAKETAYLIFSMYISFHKLRIKFMGNLSISTITLLHMYESNSKCLIPDSEK
jgi:hypothetical protein